METFKTGFSPGGMGIDSKGNVWIASHFGTSDRGPGILKQAMELAKAGKNFDPMLVRAMVETRPGPEGGCITILHPDGTEAPGSPVFGGGVVVPWACPEANPPGMKMGDQISPSGGYVGGGMQMLIDIAVDPAGNVWVDNNWQEYEAALEHVAEPLTTLGAGQGVVVFYGVAKPVRTPLIGPARGL